MASKWKLRLSETLKVMEATSTLPTSLTHHLLRTLKMTPSAIGQAPRVAGHLTPPLLHSKLQALNRVPGWLEVV
jgi:hypothetical protein